MRLKYGSFTHPLAEPAISTQRQTLFTVGGDPYAIVERWLINGKIIGTDADDVNAQAAAIKDAYASNFQDITLTLVDGTTASTHQIKNSDTLGGVRVTKPPAFPNLSRAAGVTNLDYVIEIEAEISVSSPPSTIDFQETLTFTGGGPRHGFIEILNGPPEPQTWRQQTIFRATQSGRALGYLSRPNPPSPIWPAAQIEPNSSTSKTSPRRRAGQFEGYGISWNYVYESAGPLSGEPNTWL